MRSFKATFPAILLCLGCSGARPAEVRSADSAQCVRGAVDVWTHQCDDGNAESCAVLGYTFVDGIRVPREPAKGAEFRRRACDGGEFNACGNLAWQYIHGVGVSTDFARARVYAEQGCRGGDGVACANLRFLMMQPQGQAQAAGGPKCVKGSVDICTRECNDGNAESCAVLGYTFVDGVGVPRDPIRGAQFRKRACDGGEFNACGNLAWQYIHAVGVPQDFAQARVYAGRGCNGGDGVACANLQFLMQQQQSAAIAPMAADPPAGDAVKRQSSSGIPKNAAADAAIDEGFKRWSSAWMIDQYVPGSAHAVNRGLKDGTFLARGMFGFMRGGARLSIPFAAAFTGSGQGYRLSNLCYNDETSGMTACIDPSDGQQVQVAAARSRQFLGSVVLLGLAVAMDGSSADTPPSAPSTAMKM
jgi:TPR repeat protein